MAEEIEQETLKLKGLSLSVLVEEALDDVLVVYLEHGSKRFRGVLLDADKRNIPYGICMPSVPTVEKTCPEQNPSHTLSLDTAVSESAVKPESSAVTLRHTFNQHNEENTSTELTAATTTPVKRLWDKNIRNMRLRPRQILCAKCKVPCREYKNKDSPTDPTKTSAETAKRKLPLEPQVHCKRLKTTHSQDQKKTSPIIKISFTSPEGQGTVVQIPAKPQKEGSVSDGSRLDYAHKKAKKALRKAKEKACQQVSGLTHHSHRHKMKHKHKHKSRDMDEKTVKALVQSNIHVKSASVPLKRTNDTGVESANIPNCSYDNSKAVSRFGLRQRTKTKVFEPNIKSSKATNSSVRKKKQNVPDNVSDSTSTTSDATDFGDFPGEEIKHLTRLETVRPLMMRIQTRNVYRSVNKLGKAICVGDVVWGKIQGFPWWPGRILRIALSQRDNGMVITETAHISWFGSKTMSHIKCLDLYPFLEDFGLKFDKKKRGSYKVAVKLATIAAQKCGNEQNPVVID
ncbi:PWWP domain-containing protein 2A [Lingula anatina]|uniref:PWWP domain-containing protein 2A n=1 Tax=Lingula anatina TaxID=7574 RepID=A0A1S3K948_LINAN|nr:PWWP domain-containing protein 2A [Lingula anatina]|eukprot:XP_013419148.1 PWWP domain-containing protein 2A [Lingula anatina]